MLGCCAVLCCAVLCCAVLCCVSEVSSLLFAIASRYCVFPNASRVFWSIGVQPINYSYNAALWLIDAVVITIAQMTFATRYPNADCRYH